MDVTSGRRGNRTAAALIAAALLVTAGPAILATRASSSPNLPPISAPRLLASVLQSLERVPSVSGHVATHVDLGLPQLPDEGPQATTGVAALVDSVTGDHTLRVWHSRQGFRLNELLPFGERSVTLAGSDAWAWDSSLYTAYHLVPPAGADSGGGPALNGRGPAGLLDPLTLAHRALSAITPSTSVSVGRAARVAGRDAYVLVLSPRTPATLVARVEVSIDARRRIPLRGAVYARGAGSPAVSAQFTSVGFGPIPASVYRFTPPPGAKVVTRGAAPRSGGPFRPPAGLVRTFGHDWSTIVAVRVPPALGQVGHEAGLALGSFLPYSGPLLSIRLARRGDHNWLVYGAVPQAALAAVEPRLP